MELQKVYDAVDYVMVRFRKLSACDVGIFKACLTMFGILIGVYAGKTCRRIAPLIWIAFIVSFVLLIYKLLIAPDLEPDS